MENLANRVQDLKVLIMNKKIIFVQVTFNEELIQRLNIDGLIVLPPISSPVSPEEENSMDNFFVFLKLQLV